MALIICKFTFSISVLLFQIFRLINSARYQEYLEIDSKVFTNETEQYTEKNYKCVKRCSDSSTCVAVSHNIIADRCIIVRSSSVSSNDTDMLWTSYQKIPGKKSL